MDNTFYEEQRITMARELGIPPDDLNLSSMLDSVFRGIREGCESGNNEDIILTIRNKAEEEIILGDYGQEIIQRLFKDEYPFEGVIDDYREWYVVNVIEKIDNQE